MRNGGRKGVRGRGVRGRGEGLRSWMLCDTCQGCLSSRTLLVVPRGLLRAVCPISRTGRS